MASFFLCKIALSAWKVSAPQRNAERFPKDFMFQLNRAEFDNLKYQFGTSSSRYGGRRKLPWAFTEHGAVMAANVLSGRVGHFLKETQSCT